MSPGNEIRIWHSLALKCKRGVLPLPWQFIIKATEFLLNIHEVQWIITGLAIITNFSKCTDKRVKYIIFPYVTWTDDLNSPLKLGISYFLWTCFRLWSFLHNATLFTLCSLFSSGEKMEESEQRGRVRSVSTCIRVLFHSSNSSLPTACLCFPLLSGCTRTRPLSFPKSSALCKSNNNKTSAWQNNK